MTPGRRLAPLKRELAELVVGLDRHGFSTQQIADLLGYSRWHVSSILWDHGKRGLSVNEMIRALPAQLRRRLEIWRRTNVATPQHSPTGSD